MNRERIFFQKSNRLSIAVNKMVKIERMVDVTIGFKSLEKSHQYTLTDTAAKKIEKDIETKKVIVVEINRKRKVKYLVSGILFLKTERK